MQATKGEVAKFMVWGAIAGIILICILGFTWFGWMTTGTANELSEAAVLQREAEICVAQFQADPEFEKNMAEFEKAGYNKSTFVNKGGWDKMPGVKEADYSIRNKCADLIDELVKK